MTPFKSHHEQVRERTREREREITARVHAVEAKRTMSDLSYEKQVDALIYKAAQAADAATGEMPPRRDPGRRYQWETAWSREYHAAMDALCLARGLRTQSHHFLELRSGKDHQFLELRSGKDH